MARGYPDYFGISAWPRYGSPVKDTITVVGLADGASSTLHDVTCQGIWYFQHCRLDYTPPLDVTYLVLTVDGVAWHTIIPASLSGSDSPSTPRFPLTLTFDDQVAGFADLSLPREVPFRQSIRLVLTNMSGNDITVVSTMHYYQVN